MAKINKNYSKLKPNYLFREIANRTKAFLENNPGVEILRLGIGDTTEPLPPTIINGLRNEVEKLSDRSTYTGYGDEHGDIRMRQALVEWYKKLGVSLSPQELFISDGAKPDTSNISSIFDKDSIIAVQNPVYPVYVDSNIIAGCKKFVYMACNAENGFIPSLPDTKVDLIFLCSPNNPTGAVMNKEQLSRFVEYAIKNKTIIVFDCAYEAFITDENLPRSIYEIDGANKCAIEIGSFSKSAGFTGVRLGWTTIPMELVTEDSKTGELNGLWSRRKATMFNGPSNISQEGGIAALSEKGQIESKKIINYYMENASMIKSGLEKLGLTVYGGVHAPYIWLKTPNSLSSWEFFDKLLNEAHVVGTPGSGFGSEGEGYFRLSAFGHRENIKKAVKSIEENLNI